VIEVIVSEVVSGFSFIFFVLSVGSVVVVEVVVCRFVTGVMLRVRGRSLLCSATRSFAVSYRMREVVLRLPDVVKRETGW